MRATSQNSTLSARRASKGKINKERYDHEHNTRARSRENQIKHIDDTLSLVIKANTKTQYQHQDHYQIKINIVGVSMENGMLRVSSHKIKN